MNKSGLLIFGALLFWGSQMTARQIDPLAQAMLDGYDQILKEDPKDYITLYQRGAQYYNLSRYEDAFNDIVKALQHTPTKDKEMHIRELSLLSDISIELKEYDRALEATNRLLTLDPNNYPEIYKKGNILLYLEKPEEAYRTFSTLQRLKSRSQEAFFGMAQANIKMGKMDEAEKLLTEAENADPSNYITYCRVGDLYNEMGQTERAATNYIMGYTLSNGDTRPLESLVNLANKDFAGVNKALEYAISKTSNKAPLLLVQSVLSNSSGRYNEASVSLKGLLATKEGRTEGIYRLAALNDMALNNLDDALDHIDKSIADMPSAQNYTIKGEILNRQNKPAAAMIEIQKALSMDASDEEALMTGAKCRLALDQPDKAVSYLSDVIMVNPENIEALLLRGFINENVLKNSQQAVIDYTRAGNSEADKFPDIVYKALGKAKSGKKLDGDDIVKKAMESSVLTNDELYYAAIYYSQTGDLEKGKELLDKAISGGYQNKYNIYNNATGLTNISTVRHLLK